MSIRRFALAALASALIAGPALAADTLLNVSYDPTRELYVEFNDAFNKHWQAQGHEPIKIQQSHGGSGKQARAVIDGLRASGQERFADMAEAMDLRPGFGQRRHVLDERRDADGRGVEVALDQPHDGQVARPGHRRHVGRPFDPQRTRAAVAGGQRQRHDRGHVVHRSARDRLARDDQPAVERGLQVFCGGGHGAVPSGG